MEEKCSGVWCFCVFGLFVCGFFLPCLLGFSLVFLPPPLFLLFSLLKSFRAAPEGFSEVCVLLAEWCVWDCVHLNLSVPKWVRKGELNVVISS